MLTFNRYCEQCVPNSFFNLQNMRDPILSSTLDIFHHFRLATLVIPLMVLAFLSISLYLIQ